MKYSTLFPLALACVANAARCTDKCAMAIASDGNPGVHKSIMDDCQEYLGTTYYPTTRYLQLSYRSADR